MAKIGHGYGSEWHLLRYLGYHRNAFNAAIASEVGADVVEWLDSPLSSTRERLEDDREYRGIEFIQSAGVTSQWRDYWPQTGNLPNWDAVGQVRGSNLAEWLLLEAKAHLGEMETSCGATDTGKAIINQAFSETAKSVTNSGLATEAWLTRYYQYANRLAMLNFLVTICQPSVPAHLVFVYFIGDEMPGRQCPGNEAVWRTYLHDVYKALDLNEQSPLMERVHQVFLPVNPAARYQQSMPIQKIHIIDSHTGGEPTRVVVSGGPELGEGTVAHRLRILRREHDRFRSAVVHEPRGSDVWVGALLLEPSEPSCAAGVIFFNNVGYLGMCGHGTIGVAATLAHLERIGPGKHRLETPVWW